MLWRRPLFKAMEWDSIILIFELLGTVAFALSGVLVAIDAELDLLGTLVVGAVTAVGGGVLRDLLLGNVPPNAFLNPVYALVAIGVSLVAFAIAYHAADRFGERMHRLDPALNVVDAVGLGVFTVLGAEQALALGYGGNVFLTIFVGVLTGVGGGVLRDQLTGRIPMVLKKRVYALAAIGGAVVYDAMRLLSCGRELSLLCGAGIVILIRLLATRYEWSLPKIKRQ